MIRCEDCEFDYCDVLSKYGDKDCYAYIVDAKLKPYKQALKKIEDIAKENEELLQGYHLEWANNKLILTIINEVLND